MRAIKGLVLILGFMSGCSTPPVQTSVISSGKVGENVDTFYFVEKKDVKQNRVVKKCAESFVKRSAGPSRSVASTEVSAYKLEEDAQFCRANSNCLMVEVDAKVGSKYVKHTKAEFKDGGGVDSKTEYLKVVKIKFRNPKTKRLIHQLSMKSSDEKNEVADVISEMCAAAGVDFPKERDGDTYKI